MTPDVIFLFDVDNTLLDNDAVITDLRRHLVEAFGPDCDRRYWEIFEQLRAELGYADYLGALQRYRVERPHETHVLQISLFLLHYPFADRVYHGALDVMRRLRTHGRVVILSDGDVVFQPRKIERSGLWAAAEGEVLVYIHKEQMLDDVERRYPARRYVMVDDKLRILTAMKGIWRDRLTTVFVRQGHYANDPSFTAGYPPADITIDRIAEVKSRDFSI
ncbi:MAG: haloacid dehalogenase [Acidobacteria bacterium]|nr:MAG: haloacid dehalogenase [Acidobacteriota bacterium]